MTQKIEYFLANAGKCPLCHQVIVSCHVHDFQECSCKRHFVDGGNEYHRRTVGLLPVGLYWRKK